MRLSAVEEQLSRIAFMVVPADMLLLMFPVRGGALPLCGGLGVRGGEIMTLSPGEQVHTRTNGPSRWGAILLPVIKLIEYALVLTGGPFDVPPAAQRWQPPRAARSQLISLHAAGARMAAVHPETVVNTQAAHGLEQQLMHAVVECLASSFADKGTPSQRRHQDIMAAFEGLLRAQMDQDMHVTEICTALGVSDRLLRSLCAEHLGMGPIGYAKRRRMSLVHRAFLRGNRDATSVSDVARRYGFRDPGRFSVNYRAVFGETPSATLRRREK
jgi:AraC-like DNA-binding protein